MESKPQDKKCSLCANSRWRNNGEKLQCEDVSAMYAALYGPCYVRPDDYCEKFVLKNAAFIKTR